MKLALCVLTLTLAVASALGQKTASDEMERGDRLRNAGDNRAAIEAYSKAMRRDPGSASAYVERGELLAKSQRCGDAIPDFTKALEINGDLYRAVAGRAFCVGALGNFDESIAEATHAIELNASKPEAYYTRGLGEYAKHRFQDALRDFNRAIELGMNTAVAYSRRAAARDITDDWLGAIVDHTRAIELDPLDWKKYAGRAVARRSYGDYLGAIADYDKALELAPKERMQIFDRSWAKLFNNDAAGAYQDTVDYLGDEGVANPGAPLPVIVGYLALRKMGKAEAASAFVKAALKHAKPAEWNTYLLRYVAEDLGPDKLLELAGTDELLLTNAHGLIGTKYLLDGDRRNAEVHFKWDQAHGSHEIIFHQLARTEYARMMGDPNLLHPPLPSK